MRFQDAAPDARAIVYATIQADPLVARVAELLADATPAHLLFARAVMNGERAEADVWRRMFPVLFREEPLRRMSEQILAACLEVAGRGDEVRNQYRGAIVEQLTHLLLAKRGQTVVRRERRILFDRVRSEIHPYDVTVETPGAAEAYDCKWGARGISADVLHQLDDARSHAADEDENLIVALVIFDARLSCQVRLARQTAPRSGTRLVTLETLHDLARRPPPPPGPPAAQPQSEAASNGSQPS